MSSHTLTWEVLSDVEVDGVNVTSPYTLTQDCTIDVNVSLEDTDIKINGVTYSDTATISIANEDIVMELVGGNRDSFFTVIINYTIS